MDPASRALSDLPVSELLARLAEATPAPGGGSAVAVACSLAAGLVEMAARFALLRPELADRRARMEEVQARAATLRRASLELAERDLDAYAPVLEALRLPADAPNRSARLTAARSRAANPPLEITRAGAELAGLGAELAQTGTPNLAGDAIAGALMGEAACRAAARLVELNLLQAAGDARRHETAELVGQAWQARVQALSTRADAVAGP
jgi:formiminotetrahydrofolate cyclodeaminase